MSGGTLRQAGRLSRATASNNCRKNIGLSKLSSDRTLYRKVAERRSTLLLFFSSSDGNQDYCMVYSDYKSIKRNAKSDLTEPEKDSFTYTCRQNLMRFCDRNYLSVPE